ncbi:bifunctional indole-3-glycerol-phosphate synthase TrpC/phosphoribosylanthranilate isomerase TrpF [Enterobacterales bacterium endosymbiont of Anomoneura mori]|uniref:bifunctional indole-3-glycerol-phosphate synthase TrpC/phosphoribosylanthranilate isomerase TrpF n=1 Tax=Enterobacterales bacterium endosymbiont of Anomoneura mori TaxID=3132096 RepID=UPI00399D13D8
MNYTILNNIIKDKINWIIYKKKQFSLNYIKKNIIKSNRDFYKSLKKKKTVFILECKKASPSKGIIRKNFNISKIISIYKKYADAISVLTDEKYFKGDFNFLNEVNKKTNLPILCKDFIIDEYQIYLARYYKADAILLMLSILNDEKYIKFKKIAESLNMNVLTEIINEDELNRAIKLNAKIIGINNRNLHDLSIDLNRTIKLSIKIPKNIIIISESGIKNNLQVRKISKYVNGFLIGSILMSEKNLNSAVCKIILGENKICGLTNIEDSKITYKNGIIYGGLNFVNNSIRKINIKIAFNIISKIPLKYVGIFKNENIKKIVKICEYLKLYSIQLHGKENQNYINILKKLIPKKTKIWKVFSINKKIPERNLKNIKRYVFDNKQGGTGKQFNWSLMNDKYNFNNVILAGGINIENCYKAINLKCLGLDFNSGIEIKPGIKDHKKINLLNKILRDY